MARGAIKRTTTRDRYLAGRETGMETRGPEVLLKAGALQSAIFNSAKFSSIATDANGVIQIFTSARNECWAIRPPR